MQLTQIIREVQEAVGVTVDGNAGPKTWEAIHKRLVPQPAPAPSKPITGKASSFADPKDVAAFRKCKAQGGNDQECFAKGDNGIGCWGDDTTNLDIPYVAVRPDDMIARFGSIDAAMHQPLKLTIGSQTHICIAGDRMPWAKNVKNGAVIDLAPGAQKLFGLKPPFMKPCSWQWA